MKFDNKLVQAAVNNNIEKVTSLLDGGADINSRCDDGFTALQYAAHRGHADVVKLLIDRGADVNFSYGSTNPSLMLAAGKGFSKIVEMLVEAKANINYAKSDGTTALLEAKDNGHNAVVRLISQYDRKSKQGWRMQSPDSIANTQTACGREITELFNFLSCQRTTFARNLETDAECMDIAKFEDISDDDVEVAALELFEQGGNNHSKAVLKSKKPLKIGN